MREQRACCFTGHRPQNLPFRYDETDHRCLHLKQRLRDEIEKTVRDGMTHFITGMAMGVDMYAAEIVLDLKRQYPHITLECAIPCRTQCVKWSAPMRNRYADILSRCDRETVLQEYYTEGCMMRRNRYMVDSCERVIAVWDGKPGGTGHTVRYAQAQGRTVYIINPQEL